MGTAGVVPQHARPVTFWQSTNGKKVVMAVTGAMMFAFVIGHMLGNLQIFEGPGTMGNPARIDVYGHFLHSLGELLWIFRGTMLLAIVLHITATVQLALRSMAARPVGYSRQQAINSSYASRTMYWSGPIILAFIIFHLLQFTAGVLHPHATFVEGHVYANLVSGFQVWWVSAWYIFAMCLLGLHLSHGIWSMFQSVGLAHPRHTPLLRNAARAIAILIVLGYISIPISVLLGFVK
jgi:succinate dehydrogenase / fumarate reductase cytochrome b subunit